MSVCTVGMLSMIIPNQPARLHTPLALKQEREKETKGDTIARPVVTPALLQVAHRITRNNHSFLKGHPQKSSFSFLA